MKMQHIDIGALALAMAGIGETVRVTVNGTPVVNIVTNRNPQGDLQFDLQTAELPDAPLVPVPAGTMAPTGHEPRNMAPDHDLDALSNLSDPDDALAPAGPSSIDNTNEEPL